MWYKKYIGNPMRSLKSVLKYLFPVLVLIPMAAGAIEIENPIQAQDFTELLNRIIDIIFYLSLAIAPLMLIVAGFYFVTAEGEPKKIDTAKNIIKWVLIGLLVIFCSKGIIDLIDKSIFEGTPPPDNLLE